jgi:hypothetical protein
LSCDKGKVDHWDLFLDSALMVLRSAVHASTGFSPAYLLFGYEFRTPAVWVTPTKPVSEDMTGIKALASRVTEVKKTMCRI